MELGQRRWLPARPPLAYRSPAAAAARGSPTHLSTSQHLADEQVGAHIGDLVEERAALLGPLVQPALALLERLATAALAHVRHEGPRRAAEADEGHTAVEALAGHGDGVEHVAEFLLHVDLVGEAREVGGADEGLGKDGAARGLHHDLEAEGLRDDEDVAEDDGRVEERVAVDGLESELGGEFGRLAALEEGVVFPDLEEFWGQRWAGIRATKVAVEEYRATQRRGDGQAVQSGTETRSTLRLLFPPVHHYFPTSSLHIRSTASSLHCRTAHPLS